MTNDKNLFYTMIALCVIGLLSVFSSTSMLENGMRFFIIQLVCFVIGMALFFGLRFISIDNLEKFALYIFGTTCLLLIVTLIFGIGGSSTGTNGWIRFWGIGIQPAEVAKIGFVLSLSAHIKYINNKYLSINEAKPILQLLAHLVIPVGLILLQPDLGTAMVFVIIFIVMLLLNDISWKYIVGAASGVAVLAPIVYFFVLNNAQKDRIISFIQPNQHTSGAGFNVAQAKMAIGSGGLFGQGFLRGMQTQSPYLPAKHTDFIFSCVAEEWGLIGTVVLLALFAYLVYRIYIAIITEQDVFRRNIIIGVFAYLSFHIFENIAMNLGLMPVTGIPLPFISYGGTSMITAILAVGLVNLAIE